jgi:hypothetical protein
MKYILILLALTFTLTSFAADKFCHSKDNTFNKSDKPCDSDKMKCAEGQVCKVPDANSKVAAVVPGTGEKADTACKDVVQTQAEKDAAAKAKQGKDSAGAVK